MKTNRDLYLLARAIGTSNAGYPLIDYLCALRALASRERANPMSLERVARLLTAASSFSPDAPVLAGGALADGYADADAVLARQISDLYSMTVSGQINDPSAFFGINAPSGARWYNVRLASYLECAVRGSVGGYTEDEVIVLSPPSPGESADSPVDDLEVFDWEAFTDLLHCGRCYE